MNQLCCYRHCWNYVYQQLNDWYWYLMHLNYALCGYSHVVDYVQDLSRLWILKFGTMMFSTTMSTC